MFVTKAACWLHHNEGRIVLGLKKKRESKTAVHTPTPSPHEMGKWCLFYAKEKRCRTAIALCCLDLTNMDKKPP